MLNVSPSVFLPHLRQGDATDAEYDRAQASGQLKPSGQRPSSTIEGLRSHHEQNNEQIVPPWRLENDEAGVESECTTDPGENLER